MVICAVTLMGVVATGATHLEKLAAVWGRDMTVGQFLRAVDPDTLASTTAKIRATKVTWIGPGEATMTARYAGSGSASAPSEKAGTSLLATLPDIYLNCENRGVWFDGYTVHYGALTEVTSPYHQRMPYMWLKVRLLLNGSPLHQKIVDKTSVYLLQTFPYCGLPGVGDYCCVSYHYVEFPAGYDLATYWEVKISPIESW